MAGLLVDEVCRRLSDQVLSYREAGKEWLPPERQLAADLGVSRTVVREATQRLQLQGLLEVQHGVGIRVVDNLHQPLSTSLELLIPEEAIRLRQSIEARRVLEPELARLAAERIKPDEILTLEETQRRLEQARQTEDAIEADLEFHRVLARAAGNQVFVLLLESLADLGRLSRQATILTVGKGQALAHHAQILDAVARRQPAVAAEAMRYHLHQAELDLERHYLAVPTRGETL